MSKVELERLNYITLSVNETINRVFEILNRFLIRPLEENLQRIEARLNASRRTTFCGGSFLTDDLSGIGGSAGGAYPTTSTILQKCVNLPQGTTVTQIDYYVNGDDATYTIDCEFYKIDTSGTETQIGTTKTSTASGGEQNLTDKLTSTVINNDQYSYYLKITFGQTNNSDIVLRMVKLSHYD